MKNKSSKDIFTVKEENYEDYLRWNGLKLKNSHNAKSLKAKNARYYVIYKNNNYHAEITVFTKEDNLININVLFDLNEYLDILINYLKKDYDYLTFQEGFNYLNLDMIRKKYPVIEETVENPELDENSIFRQISIKVDIKS